MRKLSKKTLVSMAMLCALSTVSVSAASNANIYINNVPIVTTVTPYIRNNYTLVPLRTIGENLGCEVAYDANGRKVTISKNNTQTELWIDKYQVNVNGNTQTLEVAPEINNGSTMVPLRFISNAFGCTVDYNADTKEVFITTSDSAPPVQTNKPQPSPEQKVEQTTPPPASSGPITVAPAKPGDDADLWEKEHGIEIGGIDFERGLADDGPASNPLGLPTE